MLSSPVGRQGSTDSLTKALTSAPKPCCPPRFFGCGCQTGEAYCASDPDAEHGPYYEWGYMHDGKLVHRSVPAERAELMQHAIDNYKRVRELLHKWELLSADEIITPEPNED